jgi:large subunit ribosomal protein L21
VFAIIQANGRQVKVTPGASIVIDGRAGEPGAAITFDQVLLVGGDGGEIFAGSPFVASAQVTGVIDGPAPGPKIRVYRKRRRKKMEKTRGHRAVGTRVRIKDIVV